MEFKKDDPCSIQRSSSSICLNFFKNVLYKGYSLHADWVFMVEARGVEPLSEDHATRLCTGVAAVLMSP